MHTSFAEELKKLRLERGLSQQQLANKLFVDRSSVAHWESGRRVPDAVIISRLARYFGVDVSFLLDAASSETTPPCIIIVDDEEILLTGAMPVISEVLPEATVTGFSKVSEALDFAEDNRIDIAFLDIEIGKVNGLELCETLTEMQPLINVVFLTGYSDYAINAWQTSACGFLVKPLMAEDVRAQLTRLKHPIKYGNSTPR